jgi:AbrB family looped-hinge helix DNA binding protein
MRGTGKVTVAKLCVIATNVTRKGQVTVPKPVRDYLGLKPGVGVIFERLANGDIVLRAAKRNAGRKAGPFARLRGRASVKMTTEEILSLTRGASPLSEAP